MTESELLQQLMLLTPSEEAAKKYWETHRSQGLSLEDHLNTFSYSRAAEQYGSFQLPYTQEQHPAENLFPPELKIAKLPYSTAEGVGSWLQIHRHQRYLPCALHSHTFIEINYQMSGSCLNIVDGKPFRMQAGDLMFLSSGCQHQIQWCEQSDLLINFLLFPHNVTHIVKATCWEDNHMTAFFVDALYQGTDYDNYIFFPNQNDPLLSALLNRIVRESLTQSPRNYLIEEVCYSAFALLAARITDHPESVQMKLQTNAIAARLLQYIMSHCVNVTRHSVAEAFGYSESYVSTLIRKTTGKTFVQLRNEFRLQQIEEELNKSGESVKKIAEKYGFENATYFYREYQKFFGHLPRRHNPTI